MPERVALTCTARLHLGFLDLNGSLGRRFGSIGLALDAPATRLVLRRAPVLRVSGPERARADEYLRVAAEQLNLPGAHELEVAEAIPAHAGLGSGTQLALGIAAALRRLHGLPPPLLARLAVPEDWRILLVLDAADQGLFGHREIAAFAELPPMAEAVA